MGQPLKYQTDLYVGGLFPLSIMHYHMEVHAFQAYGGCPGNYEAYRAKYISMRFVVCSAYDNDELVGYKLSERVAANHYHHRIVVVDRCYRGRGLSRDLGIVLLPSLIQAGCKYISLFSVPESASLDIEGPKCKMIGVGNNLKREEIKLLENIENHRKMKTRFIRNRVQTGYYKYHDGTTGDALFKCFTVETT